MRKVGSFPASFAAFLSVLGWRKVCCFCIVQWAEVAASEGLAATEENCEETVWIEAERSSGLLFVKPLL